MSDDTKALQNRATDYTVTTLKSALGAVPFVGSALAEIVGTVIPNQRVDRLADFAKKLADKVADHEAALIQKRLLEPEGVDILEEALWQSARALTEERRKHIAALVKNGLTKEQIDLIETKKLLLLLSQLNDLEIVLLRFYSYPGCRPDEDFRKKFGEAIRPVSAWIGAPQE